MSSLRLLLAVVMVAFGIFGAFVKEGCAQVDLETVIGAFQANETALLGGEAFIVRVQRDKCEDITPSKFGNGYLNVEFLVAFKDGQFLCHKHFLSNDHIKRKDLHLPPKPFAFTAKDGLLFEWQKSGPTANVRKFEQVGDMFQCLDYFRQLGLNVAKQIAASNHFDIAKLSMRKGFSDDLDHPFLPEYLVRNRTKYRINPVQEQIDGANCWVIEYPGMDKMWLDPQLGYAVRKRIYHFGPGKPKKFEIQNSDFVEAKTGLWLPRTQIVDKYASILSEDKALWDKVTSRLHYHVTEIGVGYAPDSAFDLGITDGLIIDDSVRGIEYRVASSSNDPFGSVLYDAKKSLNPYRASRIAWLIGSVLLVLSIYFAFRGNRNPVWARAILGFAIIGWSVGRQEELLAIEPQDKSASSIPEPGDQKALSRTDIEQPSLGLREGAFNWVPHWRERADCGPSALYVIANLLGKDVELNQVKQLIKVDPNVGCSIADLVQAGHSLGVDLETRFVKPSEVRYLSPPFVLHGKVREQNLTGHFIVVVDISADGEKMTVVDPVLAKLSTQPTGSLLNGYSGYVITPRSSAWASILPVVLVVCVCSVIGLPLLKKLLHARATTPPVRSEESPVTLPVHS